MVESALKSEAQAYEAKLPMMLREHAGEYVIIKGQEIEHFSESYASAIAWAYEKFGLDRFFIRKVTDGADVVHFSRDVPCRP